VRTVRRNEGRPPSFLASFSKTRMFLSKDFQRNLWRFCAISKGYKGYKPKEPTSKSFRRAGLLSDSLSAPSGRFPPSRAARGQARSAEDRERFPREWRRAGFIGQHRYGLRVNTIAGISVFRKRKTRSGKRRLRGSDWPGRRLPFCPVGDAYSDN
jgi:hypothetical protein